jgi:hypothetical protein
MRIIQSSWSCNQQSLLTSKSGWLSPEYNLMAWTLSCLQLKQYYKDVVLYCDSVSAKTLIDDLQLPYTEVVCNLDVLNSYHPQLWALPKIHAYSQQEKPFLHVDGDVFIWEKFNKDLISSGLIAQNVESATNYYETIMSSLEANLSYFPKEIKTERESKNPIIAYNAGIFGGNNVTFFKEYAAKAFEFVNKNVSNLSKINVTNFNIFFEQYLFYCLAKQQNHNVGVLIPEVIEDNQYMGFGDFTKVPFEKKYLHLLGTYKKSEFVSNQLANKLREDYPYYYYRIIELFKKQQVPLLKDYYYDNWYQKDLRCRAIALKKCYTTNNIEKEENSLEKLRWSNTLTPSHLIEKNNKKALDELQLKDLDLFCQKINSITRSKFSLISTDYLYARDLNVNQYFQYLFEDVKNIYSKKLITDDTIEIIESNYDWSAYLKEKNNEELRAKMMLEKNPLNTSMVIVAECDRNGFSITTVDSLDLILLKILEKTKTIQELLNELSDYFDESELNESKSKFEKLIFGRIKLGLHMKSIRVIF